jgi:hypothetical protein
MLGGTLFVHSQGVVRRVMGNSRRALKRGGVERLE